MNNELTTVKEISKLTVWDENQVSILKNTVAKALNSQEFLFFSEVCKATGLNPLLREIHATIHKDKQGNRNVTLITGIDGFRKAAHKTGVYAGRDKAIFTYKEGQDYPDQVEITVYKIIQGVRCPFTATAKRNEYLPSDTRKQFMWKKMKEWMLEKCCEAKALRMAFTQELSGIYEEGESHQMSDKAAPTEVKDMNKLIEAPVPNEATLQIPPPTEEFVEEKATEPLAKAETLEPENPPEEPPSGVEPDYTITKKQLGRLFAISRSNGWKDEQMRVVMKELTSCESSKELKVEPYNFLIEFLQKNKPEETLDGSE